MRVLSEATKAAKTLKSHEDPLQPRRAKSAKVMKGSRLLKKKGQGQGNLALCRATLRPPRNDRALAPFGICPVRKKKVCASDSVLPVPKEGIAFGFAFAPGP